MNTDSEVPSGTADYSPQFQTVGGGRRDDQAPEGRKITSEYRTGFCAALEIRSGLRTLLLCQRSRSRLLEFAADIAGAGVGEIGSLYHQHVSNNAFVSPILRWKES